MALHLATRDLQVYATMRDLAQADGRRRGFARLF
jgi:hypothetical protein